MSQVLPFASQALLLREPYSAGLLATGRLNLDTVA
ncbi:unnamed protein product [Ectocarpus sp. CCAP 1310/34]|nr:unnamed protein product [Ectocarpus sp. CCAP 1310/34]